jgi:hypothetical protein
VVQTENEIVVDVEPGETGDQVQNEINKSKITKRNNHIFLSWWQE